MRLGRVQVNLTPLLAFITFAECKMRLGRVQVNLTPLSAFITFVFKIIRRATIKK